MADSNAGNRWLPLIGGTMLNVVLGSFYAWSVFVLPLEGEFGWAREQTSTTFSIGIFTMAVTFVLAGRLHATVGFRTLAAIGGILFSAGFFLASYTTSLTVLYITYGLIAGAGTASAIRSRSPSSRSGSRTGAGSPSASRSVATAPGRASSGRSPTSC